jgi:hypothetical protein
MKEATRRKASLETNPGLVIAGGLLTLAAVFLAYGAFDDITTDNATSFTFEYTLLTVCAVWCLFIAIRFLVRGRHLLGIMSLSILCAAVWGQRAIGPGTVPNIQPEYIATVVSLIWFLMISLALLVVGFRRLV